MSFVVCMSKSISGVMTAVRSAKNRLKMDI